MIPHTELSAHYRHPHRRGRLEHVPGMREFGLKIPVLARSEGEVVATEAANQRSARHSVRGVDRSASESVAPRGESTGGAG